MAQPQANNGWTPVEETPPSGWTPVDESPRAAAPTDKPGFLSTLGGDLKSMIRMPSAPSPYPGMDVDTKQSMQQSAQQQNQSEKQAGYGPGYRTAAAAGSALGVNVPGMEESARQGDVGGVLGHATAVPAVMAGSDLIPRAIPPVVRGAAKTTNLVLDKGPGIVGAGVGAAAGHASGIPYAGVLGGKIGYDLGNSLPKMRVPGENFAWPKSPVRAAQPVRLVDQVKTANDVTPALTGKAEPWTPPRAERQFVPGSREDYNESAALIDKIRENAGTENRSLRTLGNEEERFLNTRPSTPKSVLNGTANKPVKYTTTKQPRTQPLLPEDLTPLLRQSLKMAMRRQTTE